MRMIRILGFTILIVMLMDLSAYSEEWLGMFNMDRYPVEGCKVVKTYDGTISDTDDFHFLLLVPNSKSIKDAIENSENKFK